MQFEFKPSDWTEATMWVVYSHTITGQAPAWIGYCRAADLMLCPDAYQSNAWRDVVLPAPVVRCSVCSRHANEPDAMRAAMSLLRRYRPPVNAATRSSIQNGPEGKGGVMCVTTGAVYESAAAACRAHGIYEPQMSVYLNKRNPGRIRGLVFRRI